MAQKENKTGGTANRGFASMDKEKQRAIARKGGEAVSGNRAHMAEIGKRGGESRGNRSQRERERLAANSAKTGSTGKKEEPGTTDAGDVQKNTGSTENESNP
ncbi:MAG: KGG domain-containing protein [Bacteroidota bacterium]